MRQVLKSRLQRTHTQPIKFSQLTETRFKRYNIRKHQPIDQNINDTLLNWMDATMLPFAQLTDMKDSIMIASARHGAVQV
jgi:hypothetical protein